MSKDIPDYIRARIAGALESYGFVLDNDKYVLEESFAATPDKYFYFISSTARPETKLVLLTEDYITGLDYIKGCFSEEIDADLIELHKVVKGEVESNFNERDPVRASTVYKKPEDWDDIVPYAVDFVPHFFGFLATIKPNNQDSYFENLRKRNS